jgi:hypothetical protein
LQWLLLGETMFLDDFEGTLILRLISELREGRRVCS